MVKKSLTIWFYIIIFTFGSISSVHATKFAVISDAWEMGLDKVLEFIASQKVAFIIIAGDFYYDGQDYYSHFEKYGFEVKPDIEPDLQNVYFVLGNHDSPPFGDATFRKYIAPYYPENGPISAPQGTIFAFDRNNCHFVITNQYWNYGGGGYTSDQLDWIKQDLEASDQPFKFVFGHEPAFPLDRHVGNSLDADPVQRDLFWNILAENDVQAFFCGHTHNLSHILDQGVYQIDNGEVRPSSFSVTIVDVTSNEVVIKSYRTFDVLLDRKMNSIQYDDTASPIDPVVETYIDLNQKPEISDRVDILYDAPNEEDFWDSFCFIGTIFQ